MSRLDSDATVTTPGRMHRPSPRRVTSATLAVLGLAATAAVAGGAVTPGPRFVRPRLIIASVPNVPSAISSRGEALTLRPGSGPGPALQLATAHGQVRTIQLTTTAAGYDNPSVAIGDSGVVAATWDTSSTTGSTPDVVEMAVGTFAAPPTSASVLSTPGVAVSGEQAFVTRSGTAVVIWNQIAGALSTVRAAIVPPGGTPRPVTIAANESYVGAGLDTAGGLAVIEQDSGAFTQQTISTDGSVIGRGVDFAAPQAVSDAAALAGELGVLFDAAGAQLYSWRPPGPGQKLYAVWRSPAGSFGPVQTLGASADEVGGGPRVAINAAGQAVAVFTPRRTGPLSVRFATELAHFGPPRRVGAAGRFAEMPVVSLDNAGRALLAWVDSPTSSRGTTRARAQVAESHGGHFTAPVSLPVEAGLGQKYLGDAPITAAAPGGKPELITYGASKGSSAVGQIAFVTG
jgi:hypothetical protein